MMKKRGLAIMLSAFAVVLLGGVALAQIADVLPGNDEPAAEVTDLSAASETTSSTDATVDDDREPVADEERVKDEEPVKDKEPVKDEDSVKEEPSDDPEHPADENPPSDDEMPDTTPPEFVILSPEDGAYVDDTVITVAGKVEPGATVTFAGRYEADVSEDGRWHIALALEPGKNRFTLVAKDPAGNASEATVTVYLEREPDHAFSAHQKWEIVDGTPAANKYYGTGVPGTHVWIVSDAGGAETKVTVGENGEWDAYVEFPKAPCGEWFAVVVEAEAGRKVFEMKWVCPDGDGAIEFTAHQQYGSCGEAVPYDVFWGTEDPGTKIWVESPYGSGTVKANEQGEWEILVEFPEAPVGKTFEVVIESNDGGRKVFTFTRTSEGEV